MQKISEGVLTKVRMRLKEEQAGKLRKIGVLARSPGAQEHYPAPFAGDEADKAVVSNEEELKHLELCRITSSARSIEVALLTIELGRYGVCLRCDQQIPARRLKAIPSAVLCRDCQQGAEEARADQA